MGTNDEIGSDTEQAPWRDPAVPAEDRVADLISRMALEEKVAQLYGVWVGIDETEGEERQAEEMVRLYRTLVSHLSVQAITYWGLSDEGSWLGAPVGLVRADGTPKPSYDALRDLVKGEWWLAPTRLRTDGEGRVPVRGWAGDYVVSVGDSSGSWKLRHDAPLPEVTLA